MNAPVTNILVMQSGGCTNVLNTSLAGVVDEAVRSGALEESTVRTGVWRVCWTARSPI